jgi:hypothetical protein
MVYYMFAKDSVVGGLLREGWPGPSVPGSHPGQLVRTLVVDASQSPSSLVTWIKKSTPEKIELLKLLGHGNGGYLALGTGLTASSVAAFTALRGWFTKDSDGIEIHACLAASDIHSVCNRETRVCIPTPFFTSSRNNGLGYQLLSALAAAAGVRVKAGINLQYGDNAQMLEGATVTVLPSGSLIHEIP